uniref:Uncharacterized protein MLCB1450.18 n=1 Tax=Mycobacterium leprae TaxID=1769 RepID=Q9ZBL9_MYCLR|nr:hypothetical protein MLCB1450.18 [Mycobacterium leprae]
MPARRCACRSVTTCLNGATAPEGISQTTVYSWASEINEVCDAHKLRSWKGVLGLPKTPHLETLRECSSVLTTVIPQLEFARWMHAIEVLNAR